MKELVNAYEAIGLRRCGFHLKRLSRIILLDPKSHHERASKRGESESTHTEEKVIPGYTD